MLLRYLILFPVLIYAALLLSCSHGKSGPVRFAVIGDYGLAGDVELSVSRLVLDKYPDFIITVGDNNYPTGSAAAIDDNIGKYFYEYIYPYKGNYGEGAQINRFFPALGNHDLIDSGGQAYFDYFELPNNERYYDFQWGPVHFFAINSNPSEPDGITPGSHQAIWLQGFASESRHPWKIVFFHHAPYSSAMHGSTADMQWDFASMGISAVFAGHDHTYERIHLSGVVYFVTGVCYPVLYQFGAPVTGSAVRYNAMQGAMIVEADEHRITFDFYNINGVLVDHYVIEK